MRKEFSITGCQETDEFQKKCFWNPGNQRSAIPLCPEKVTCLTLAVITLHNFLLQSPNYIPPNLVDVEVSATGHVIPGTWRNEALPSSWLNYKPYSATITVEMQRQ